MPYKGTPEAVTGVMGGRTDFFFAPLLAALPMIMPPQQFNPFIRTEMESAARIAHTASLKAQ